MHELVNAHNVLVHNLLQNSQLVDHPVFPHFARAHLLLGNDLDGAGEAQLSVLSLYHLAVAAISDNLANIIEISDISDSPQGLYLVSVELMLCLEVVELFTVLIFIDIIEFIIRLGLSFW